MKSFSKSSNEAKKQTIETKTVIKIKIKPLKTRSYLSSYEIKLQFDRKKI